MCIFGSDAVMQDNSKVCIGYAVGVYNLMPGFVINKQAYFIGVEKEITAYFFYIYDRKHFVSGCRCMRLFIQLSRIVAIFPEIHGNHRFYTVVVPAVNGVISVLSEIQVFAL